MTFRGSAVISIYTKPRRLSSLTNSPFDILSRKIRYK